MSNMNSFASFTSETSISSGRFSSIVYLKSFANNFELFANNINIYHC